MTEVCEVQIDEDLTLLQPVHQLVEVDSGEDTDYSVEEDNPTDPDLNFLLLPLEEIKNPDPQETNIDLKTETIKNEESADADVQHVSYNNSKYFKKQKKSQGNSIPQQSYNNSNNGVQASSHIEINQRLPIMEENRKRHRHSETPPQSESQVKVEVKQETIEGAEVDDIVEIDKNIKNIKEIVLTKYSDIRSWKYSRLGDDFISGVRSRRPCNIQFKVLSFNILSQDRIDRQHRSFGKKQDHHLSWEYRLQGIQREINTVDADIVCMQEIQFTDQDTINTEVGDFMMSLGYKHHAFKRKGTKNDGCVIFYKEAIFVSEEVSLVKLYNDEIACLKSSSSVGIIVRLRTKQASWVVIGTLHLQYGSDKHLTRLAQTAIFLAELKRVCTGDKGQIHPCILAGDFNMEPYTDLHRLIVKGKLKYKGQPCGDGVYPDKIFPEHFGIGNDLNWTLDRKPSLTGNFYHNFGFRSVYQYREERALYLGYAPPESEVTAYQGKWVSVDHIFYSTIPARFEYGSVDGRMEKYLKFIGKWRLPSCSQITKVGGLPSIIAPSDHLPLAAEFLLIS